MFSMDINIAYREELMCHRMEEVSAETREKQMIIKMSRDDDDLLFSALIIFLLYHKKTSKRSNCP